MPKLCTLVSPLFNFNDAEFTLSVAKNVALFETVRIFVKFALFAIVLLSLSLSLSLSLYDREALPIVREVREVRERERERERDTESERERESEVTSPLSR